MRTEATSDGVFGPAAVPCQRHDVVTYCGYASRLRRFGQRVECIGQRSSPGENVRYGELTRQRVTKAAYQSEWSMISTVNGVVGADRYAV
ncbi:hypothetical protein CCUG62472_02075 [Mycobacteroides salmoniphilum]|nr:hypothetical protein CCUG62472_02075 [Mycobacteroides salmoniphilum]